MSHERILPLSEVPHALPRLVAWFMGEWPVYYVGRTPTDVEADFLPPNAETVWPLVLVALDGDEPVGTVAIRGAWDAAPHIAAPWIGGLHVVAERRHAGLGMRLVDAALRTAADAGHDAAHCGVTVAAERFFERGWEPAGTTVAGDETVTLLRRRL